MHLHIYWKHFILIKPLFDGFNSVGVSVDANYYSSKMINARKRFTRLNVSNRVYHTSGENMSTPTR